MTASPRLLGSMFYSAWGLLSLTLIALLVIRPVESCEVAKSPINGSWDHSSLWSGCTGANGLPGLEDDVVVSGLGVAITIYSNTTVKVASLTIATYASVKNLGSLTTPTLNINGGGELNSDGTLAVTTTNSAQTATSVILLDGRLTHTDTLKIGPNNSITTGDTPCSATLSIDQSDLSIGGSLLVTSNALSSVGFTCSTSSLELGGLFTLIGGVGGNQWNSETCGLLMKGMQIETFAASHYSNTTGSVSFVNSHGWILNNSTLTIQSGNAQAQGSSGNVYIQIESTNHEILGAVVVASGSVDTLMSVGEPGNVTMTNTLGALIVQGSMSMAAGNGGSASSGNGGEGGSISWELNGVHVDIEGSLSLIAGNGGNGSQQGGNAGSASLQFAGPSFLGVTGNLLVQSGYAGNSTTATGGNAAPASIVVTTPGSFSVDGHVMVVVGGAGDGISGGNGNTAYLTVSSCTFTVGSNLMLISHQAGNSIGQSGSGGSCLAQASPLSVSVATLMVGGGLEIVICGSGHGIGANAGKPLPTSYQTIPLAQSSIQVNGTFSWTGGAGGSSLNSTAARPRGGDAASIQLSLSTVYLTVLGDFIIETSAGGSLTGSSSGVSGAGGNILILQQSASYLSIGGSMTLTGGESGNVHGTQGMSGYGCFVKLAVQDSTMKIGEDLTMEGCNSGTLYTTSSSAQTGIPLDAGQMALSISNGAVTVGTYLIMIAGQGVNGTTNNGTEGGDALMQVTQSSQLFVTDTLLLQGGAGGSSTMEYGGMGGVANITVSLESNLRTAELTLGGGAAGEGNHPQWDGAPGFPSFSLSQFAVYNQYGPFEALVGGYRGSEVTPSMPLITATQRSQWTVFPCSVRGFLFFSRNYSLPIASFASFTLGSTYRDCRNVGKEAAPAADISSDVSCASCSCEADALLFNECHGGASATHSTAAEAIKFMWKLAAQFLYAN